MWYLLMNLVIAIDNDLIELYFHFWLIWLILID